MMGRAAGKTVWTICKATRTIFDGRRMCSLDAISRRCFRECLPTMHYVKTEDACTLLLNHCRYWMTSGSFNAVVLVDQFLVALRSGERHSVCDTARPFADEFLEQLRGLPTPARTRRTSETARIVERVVDGAVPGHATEALGQFVFLRCG